MQISFQASKNVQLIPFTAEIQHQYLHKQQKEGTAIKETSVNKLARSFIPFFWVCLLKTRKPAMNSSKNSCIHQIKPHRKPQTHFFNKSRPIAFYRIRDYQTNSMAQLWNQRKFKPAAHSPRFMSHRLGFSRKILLKQQEKQRWLP